MPFLIQHPDGREYELSSYAFFQEEYEPAGFTIVDPARNGYTVPVAASQPKTKVARIKATDTPESIPVAASVTDG